MHAKYYGNANLIVYTRGGNRQCFNIQPTTKHLRRIETCSNRQPSAKPQCATRLCQKEEVPEPKAESTPSDVPVLLAPMELADDALLPNMSLLSSLPVAAQTETKSVDVHMHLLLVQTCSSPRSCCFHYQSLQEKRKDTSWSTSTMVNRTHSCQESSRFASQGAALPSILFRIHVRDDTACPALLDK